ncbi:SMI1/KNR4 family protein [Chitinivorax sp. B]|uniref:SMI1/KNR4 family protein n=1 Tax=Chitinivorax sp. B TaxID=2502235 RepID=UPI0010F43B52|nr:SMI1/KNR4 family protein [Chitinivorax sp. B]
MSDMREKLIEIYNTLALWGRPVVNLLQPGMEKNAAKSLVADTGLVLTDDIYELYEWRNGTKVVPGTILDDLHFFPGFYFLSLEDALTSYQAFKDDDRWDKCWLPLFANGGGDFYVADLSLPANGASPVRGFMIGEINHPIEYESVGSMIKTLALCYRNGAYYLDADGRYLEANDNEHALIAKVNNPSVLLWQ